jgi:hypothetical protein
MTNIAARLLLREFMVFAQDMKIYSQKFHAGLNVIRGDHAVGKSTLMDLIFYSLGGELRKDQWVYPADHCSMVCAEVEISGKIFCLKREIDVGSIPAIEVFDGSFDEGMRSLIGWQSYGPRRTDRKSSFSQLLFDLLGWGNTKTDDYANLTMHQALRLLYADQETPANKIFRAEPQNSDSESTRLAIGEFLLSLDDLELHRARQDLLSTTKLFDKTSSELAAILGVLGKDSNYSVEALNFEITNLLSDIKKYENTEQVLNETQTENSDSPNVSPEIEELNKEIDSLLSLISKNDANLSFYVGEISDCVSYKKSLVNRRKSLLESKTTSESIGGVAFGQCPCCNSKVKESQEENICPLCKTENSHNSNSNAYLQILAELDFQEKQNSKLLSELESRLANETNEKKTALQILNAKKSLLRKITGALSRREVEVAEVARKIGFAEAQIATLNEKIAIIQKVDKLRSLRVSYGKKLVELNDLIIALNIAGADRKTRVVNAITSRALDILELDEEYEPVFKNATEMEAEIDFAKDRWLVDGRSKFSGSSNFFKKNALHAAILSYAIVDKKCRHPRFLILDDVENGGMTAPRSQNFQRILARIISGKEDQCQVILATAMVDAELNNDEYGVGPSYEKGNYVLQLPESH